MTATSDNASGARARSPAAGREPLFRPQAVNARRPGMLGRIVIVRPVSFALLSAAAACIACVIIGFLIWGTYTKHSTLSGRLVPDLGVIKVHTPQQGTIVEKHAAEGRAIEQGELLYVISSERLSSALEATHARVGRELEARRLSLEAQLEQTRELERAELQSHKTMQAAWRDEARHLRGMLASQRERLAIAEDTASRYTRIRSRGFVSEEQVMARRGDVIEQRARLQNLERELGDVERRLEETRARLERLPLEHANQRAELERAIAAARQERTQNEARRRVAVTAPASGTVTAVVGERGQTAEAGRPLASIVPAGAKLRAELYAPSRAIGFIEAGDTALLRLQAYPYQKFGHQRARIESISRAAAPPAELTGTPATGTGGATEPIYRITAALRSQTIEAYGRPHALQAGMAVEADVPHETRRLYEWVLEPLHTLTKRLH